ncbi:MAG TPA: serine/threonine-protein kinase [Kofleriaceae bacterium]|nr:serine/threonine-protein kinase [Kofleriaceae bacterium]
MARVCSQCGKSFGDTTTFCTEDGSPLVAEAEAFANTMMPDRLVTRQGGPATSPEGELIAPMTGTAPRIHDPGSSPIMLPGPRTGEGGPDTAVNAHGHTGVATGPAAQHAFVEPQLIELTEGTAVGEYIVEQQIGEGGMGVIFSARHPIIGKRVAIKVLNPDMAANVSIVQRFIQEARSVNQIGHRNIVDIFSFGRLADGRHYFVMEHLDGMPFSKRINQALDWPEAVAIWLQMAGAVEAAHQRGIIHRDLKPDNVFITPGADGPFVKVLDFGIAKLMGGDTGVQKTSTGVPMGTPLYMSPEQTRGGVVDHRTDLYAMGCILYETVTGETPFNAPSFFEVMSKQLTEPPPPFGDRAEVDHGLQELIFECLEKEPDARPASMSEVRDRLVELRDLAVKSGQPLFVRAGRPAPVAKGGQIGADVPTHHDEGTDRQNPVKAARAVAAARRAAAADAGHTVPEPRDSQEYPAVPAAAGQPAAAPRSPAPLILGLVAVLAVLGGVGYVVLKKDPQPVTPPVVIAPPPVVPVLPTKGNVKIISTESGITFFLDGEKVGEGGPVLQVATTPGRHEIKVTRPGFLAYSNQVMVAAGETTDDVIKLQPEAVVKPPSGSHRPKDKKDPVAPVPVQPTGPRDKDATINPFGK